MRELVWVIFFLFFPLTSFAAAKEEEPDREMLRVMELLGDWEMIKNLDLIRQLETPSRRQETTSEQGFQRGQKSSVKDKQK
ncbi:MAG: hypothetical protein ACREQA_25140 [Candidatus Binatia bacterium]